MRIGTHTETDTACFRNPCPAPIQVETIAAAIDLDQFSMLRCRLDQLGHVDTIAGSRQEEPPRGMSQNGDIGICEGATYAARLIIFRQIESAMNGRDDEIELCKQVV